MKVFKSSLLPRLILAFWVVSLAGIVIVSLLAGRASQLEFNRFANDTRYQGVVDKLGGYYQKTGSFSGAGYILEEAQNSGSGSKREFIVVDPDGNILLSLAQHIPPGLPSPDFIRFGFPIENNGHVIGYLIPMRPPRSPLDSGTENLQRINLNLVIGAIVALLIALIFGWLLARNIMRPLRDLNHVTQAIAHGDLEKTVRINSRDEIGALADSFNSMIGSLKRSRDLRREMTADIAHELRNPLSIILGHSEAISEGVLPATPETLEIIYDEAKHLSRLVEDLRTLSLSESGELHLERSPVKPEELLEHSSAAYAIRAAEKGITIRIDPGTEPLPLIDVDFERMNQVMSNLVDNALKHTASGGLIVLSAKHLEVEKKDRKIKIEMIELAVEDNGNGIQPADLPHIFDRFYRGSKTSPRIQDGSGLGLAISRALIELHGGSINAESEIGKGTRISIHLPMVIQ